MGIFGRPAANRTIPHLRWWIGALLFASTVINYIDRQTLSLLAPFLKVQYHWTNTDYANIIIAFHVAYSIDRQGLGMLFDGIDRNRAGAWLFEFRGISVSAGCGGIRELAGRDESRLGMVSETRT